MSNPTRPEEGAGNSVQSASAITHREIDIEQEGVGASSSDMTETNRRPWRFDFDLNIDPSWFTGEGSGVGQFQRPLSMLNTWVRGGSIPDNSPATTVSAVQASNFPTMPASGNGASNSHNHGTTSAAQSRRGSSSPTNGPTSFESAQHSGQTSSGGSARGAHGHGRRSSSQNRSATTENGELGDLEESLLQGPGDPQPFVVDMGGNGTWPDSPTESPRAGGNNGRESSTASSNPESPTSENVPSEILRLRQSPEARALINGIERYAPFFITLLIKCILDHGSGILCFLGLLISFTHANSLFKKEVAKQAKRNIFYLAMIIVNLMICVVFIYYVFQDQELYKALIFLKTKPVVNNIWILIWIVGVTDYISKFLTIVVKAIVLAIPEQVLPFQKRGKYYLFVERSSQLYRSFLPVHPFFLYLFDSYDGTFQVFGGAMIGIYVLLKLRDVIKCLKAWRVAFGKMLQQTHYGTIPTAEEVSNSGAQCPICHDSFVHPIRLSCSHLFCEECVSTWFDRERTCPMCRAKVVDDPKYRDGATAHFIQVF